MSLVVYFQGISGKGSAIHLAMRSKIVKDNGPKSSINKQGQFFAIKHMGKLVGDFIVTILLIKKNYSLLYTVILLAYSISFVLCYLYLSQNPMTDRKLSHNSKHHNTNHSSAEQNLWISLPKIIRDIDKGCLTVIAISIYMYFCRGNRYNILLLYARSTTAGWTDTIFSSLLGYKEAVQLAILIFVIPFLHGTLKLTDMEIIFLSVILKIGSYIVLLSSTHMWHIYLHMTFGVSSILVDPAVKAYIGAHIDRNNLGKAFSLLQMIDHIAQMLGSLVLTQLYVSSLETVPSLIYILMAVTGVLLCPIFFNPRKDGLSLLHKLLGGVKTKTE